MIDFYYWGYQCPYNYSNRLILERIKEDHQIEINFHDIADDHKTAHEMNLFSPTMTVFDKGLRWSGPITYELIEKYLKGEPISRKPYIVNKPEKIIEGDLRLFTPDRVEDIKCLCCSGSCENSSAEKGKWLKSIMSKYGTGDSGVLHYSGGKCIGGAEFVPSLEVPYNIPKSEDAAFLTCLYSSDPVYDKKRHPLKRLEGNLKAAGFGKIYAVASERVAFPNGPLEWFLDNGYRDAGFLFYEENDDAYQHLVEKEL